MQSVPITTKVVIFETHSWRGDRLCCILFQVRSLGMQNMMVGWFMVFNTTFNNISVISWPGILLVEEIEVPGEKQ
jgi:hypothetical protein